MKKPEEPEYPWKTRTVEKVDLVYSKLTVNNLASTYGEDAVVDIVSYYDGTSYIQVTYQAEETRTDKQFEAAVKKYERAMVTYEKNMIRYEKYIEEKKKKEKIAEEKKNRRILSAFRRKNKDLKHLTDEQILRISK